MTMTARNETSSGVIDPLMQRAQAAMRGFGVRGQESVDLAVRALAWAVYQPGNARRLAEIAVEETGLGDIESKVLKNRRKTFGTLRDLLRVRTIGRLDEDRQRGLVRYGKPVGVVAAVCPSTNPTATPVNKAMMAIKGGNAVIIAPSPGSWRASAATVQLMRDELAQCGASPDLVQILPSPITKVGTQALLEAVDLAVVTGSQNTVSRAMRSGTVTIATGPGNVPVIVDSCADLEDAAAKITTSKCFDNATSCSSENAVILLDDVYEAGLQALQNEGGWLCSPADREAIAGILWRNGTLNRDAIARDARSSVQMFGLPEAAAKARFFLVEESVVTGAGSFADEKLSLVLAVYRARDFAHALTLCQEILRVKGKGHSAGIHTRTPAHAQAMAESLDVVRILVNQAHCLGTGGSFENGLPFTLSMGGGTWAGSSISENLSAHHFINITHLVNTISTDRPSEADLFAPLWEQWPRRSDLSVRS